MHDDNIVDRLARPAQDSCGIPRYYCISRTCPRRHIIMRGVVGQAFAESKIRAPRQTGDKSLCKVGAPIPSISLPGNG